MHGNSGSVFIDFNPSIGFITMVLMVVDGASVHDISLAFTGLKKQLVLIRFFNWEALTYCGDAVYMRKKKILCLDEMVWEENFSEIGMGRLKE